MLDLFPYYFHVSHNVGYFCLCWLLISSAHGKVYPRYHAKHQRERNKSMTKKGGVQQLQADIGSDEDFEKLLERPGLLVLDIYSEWCGPCVGMVGSLRKIKLEVGGDNLQLAVCKSDSITRLKRFTRKSEPTWLFVVNGKAVNIMFGTDVPKLVSTIIKELERTLAKEERTTYDITELQPIELAQQKIKDAILMEAEKIELEAKDKERLNYLRYVTDVISENMPDFGVSVFGPQVNRDMFKKISEPAELLKMQCKDRKVIAVTKENFATVNFECDNPLDPNVIDYLNDKELLMCFWKIDETLGNGDVTEILVTYANNLTKEIPVTPDAKEPDELQQQEQENGDEEEQQQHQQQQQQQQFLPPIISPIEVTITCEVEDEILPEIEVIKEENPIELPSGEVDVTNPINHGENDEESENLDEKNVEAIDNNDSPEGTTSSIHPSEDAVNETTDKTDKPVARPSIANLKKLKISKVIQIPPIWVPNNKRTHAALIYVFFRAQTTNFLPPDPIPDPPHVIMAFDAYKKKDLINIIEKFKDDIPLYGFFTSDDPMLATLIANSVEKYNTKAPLPTDKLIVKVNKSESSAMQTLLLYGPSYISPNTVVGQEEALKFFPENYVSALQEALAQINATETGKPKKRKKNKKNAEANKVDNNGAQQNAQVDVAAEKTAKGPPEEGTTSTSSGDESGESRPTSAQQQTKDDQAAETQD